MTMQGVTEKRIVNFPDKMMHTCPLCSSALTNVRVVLEIVTASNGHHIDVAGYGDCKNCGDGQDSFGWEKHLRN